MALPATHIRFALDMADRFPVEHLDRYIAGTLYPDSRWLTGVARLKSHDPRYLESIFPFSDYTLGIHIHCMCDKIQSGIFEATLPGLAGLLDQERWVYLSAAKMIQDRLDMQAFDMQTYLPCLDYAENPNQEDIQRVRVFNRIIQSAYHLKTGMNFQDYYNLWVHVTLSTAMAAAMVREMERLSADNGLVERIKQSYDEILERV
jgi:hypothetical protein